MMCPWCQSNNVSVGIYGDFIKCLDCDFSDDYDYTDDMDMEDD